jgi:hypothetical protein
MNGMSSAMPAPLFAKTTLHRPAVKRAAAITFAPD